MFSVRDVRVFRAQHRNYRRSLAMYNTYILYITMLKKHNIMNTPPGRDGMATTRRMKRREGETLYSSLL